MLELTEEKIYEAFGLEKPAEVKEEEGQSLPAEEEKPETATKAEESSMPEETEEAEPTEEKSTTEREPLSEEERRENARRRREREKKEAIDSAVSDALKREREKNEAELKSFFETAQLKNTITGEPITNMEEFKDWKEKFDAEKLEQDLKNGKLTHDALKKIVSENPAIKRAEELFAEADRRRQTERDEAGKKQIAAEIAEIHKQDPAMGSLEDILKSPCGEKFREYVNKGNSFIDAWYLANREKIEADVTEKAKRQAAISERSKEHLRATGTSQGTGSVSVPRDVMAMYRAINPRATDAEIQAHYNKSHKN